MLQINAVKIYRQFNVKKIYFKFLKNNNFILNRTLFKDFFVFPSLIFISLYVLTIFC